MKIFLILFLACLYSCASISADWTPWQMEDIQSKERTWRFCSEELDGPEYANKGMCYISEECRSKKVLIGKDKKECRNLMLFCIWGDLNCMVKYGINNMTISNKK